MAADVRLEGASGVSIARSRSHPKAHRPQRAPDPQQGSDVHFSGEGGLHDRPIEPKHGNIVLAVLNNEFTVKRLHRRGGVVKLVAENPIYPPIVVKDGEELTIWGVVTRNLHKLL